MNNQLDLVYHMNNVAELIKQAESAATALTVAISSIKHADNGQATPKHKVLKPRKTKRRKSLTSKEIIEFLKEQTDENGNQVYRHLSTFASVINCCHVYNEKYAPLTLNKVTAIIDSNPDLYNAVEVVRANKDFGALCTDSLAAFIFYKITEHDFMIGSSFMTAWAENVGTDENIQMLRQKLTTFMSKRFGDAARTPTYKERAQIISWAAQAWNCYISRRKLSSWNDNVKFLSPR